MAWTIELTLEARKKLAKLDTTEARRILHFLHHRLRAIDNPRQLGKPLVGPTLSGLWRYRVGNYRVLCRIEDERICIVALDIGHRSIIYKK